MKGILNWILFDGKVYRYRGSKVLKLGRSCSSEVRELRDKRGILMICYLTELSLEVAILMYRQSMEAISIPMANNELKCRLFVVAAAVVFRW